MKAAGRDRALFFAAVAAGALAWWAFARTSHAFDAFDAAGYWTAGLAFCALVCAALGYAGARSAWRWPFVVFGAQFVTATVGRGGDAGNLWPISLALFAALATAHLVPAYVGVGLRRLVETRKRQALDEAVRRKAFAAGAARAGAASAPAAHSETPDAPDR
jgi:hypothetical protein